MADYVAVLVEDDPEQAAVTEKVMAAAGFNVVSLDSIEPAMTFLEAAPELVDLFVLDRRLPLRPDEPASDELGDEFISVVRTQFSDARVIVFTGFADIQHVQNVLRNGGSLPSPGAEPLDRVSVLEKHQSLEFKSLVEDYAALLRSLDDIELRASADEELTLVDRRIIRRIAFEHGAMSVEARRLAGGLTGAAVWRCDLRRVEGSVARVVAKTVGAPKVKGGLSELLPVGSVTTTMATISGLVGGRFINVIQLAGESSESLMDLLVAQPAVAAEVMVRLRGGLSSVPESEKLVTFEGLVSPLVGWEDLEERSARFGMVPPSRGLVASVRFGMRHCDLHPLNVLVVDGNPIVIDFDSNEFGSSSIDPVTLLFATLTHPESAVGGEKWFDVDDIKNNLGTQGFGRDTASAPWVAVLSDWIWGPGSNSREAWGVVYGYGARQLGYDDVLQNAETVRRVLAVMRVAAARLSAS